MTYLFIDTTKIASELDKISICAEDFEFENEYELSFCVSSPAYNGNITPDNWKKIEEIIQNLYSPSDISTVICDTNMYKVRINFNYSIESV